MRQVSLTWGDGKFEFHMSPEELRSLVALITRLLAGMIALASLVVAVFVIYFMHDANSVGEQIGLVIGIAFGLVAAILTIALLLPNAPILKQVLSGLAGLAGKLLSPLVHAKQADDDGAPKPPAPKPPSSSAPSTS
jgi:hypothetical protein